MSFGSVGGIGMRWRGCWGFRSCPRVGEDGQSIWLHGSPNPIRDAAAVLVLDLRPPELPAFKALLLRRPTWLSYAVSYLFIAIVWANHHHLILYPPKPTPPLIWSIFAHLFPLSLLPLPP